MLSPKIRDEDELLAATQEFAKSNLTVGNDDDFDPDLFAQNWNACADQGIFGLFIPQAYGGSGLSLRATVKALETLGYHFPDDGFTLGINGQMWAVQEPILQFGTESQKQEFLPKLINGSCIGAHGMTEQGSGSNAFGLQTTADKVADGYALNGKKIYIGLSPICDLILTFASTDLSKGRWGISCFLVDSTSEGVSLSPAQEKMGLRTGPLGEVTFENVLVDESRMLGRPGAGASIFNASMQYERSFIFASHVGAMARQLDETIKFAKERQVADQSIGKHQTVANRIADMKIRLDTSRMYLYRAADLIDAGESLPLEAAMAKLVISESYVENSLAAIRIHGGKGYMSQYGIERNLRNAIGGVIYSGTSDIQRNLIAGILGL